MLNTTGHHPCHQKGSQPKDPTTLENDGEERAELMCPCCHQGDPKACLRLSFLLCATLTASIAHVVAGQLIQFSTPAEVDDAEVCELR